MLWILIVISNENENGILRGDPMGGGGGVGSGGSRWNNKNKISSKIKCEQKPAGARAKTMKSNKIEWNE